MSSNPNDRSNHEIEPLQARVHNLRQVLSRQVEKTLKKRKTYLTVGICLVCLSIAALGNLTRLTFALDAQALTEIGRAELERNLPGGRESMKAFLEGEAPHIVSGLIAGFTEAIPSLRPFLLEQLTEKTRTITQSFEEQLAQEMKSFIRSSKEDIDQELPGATDVEKLEKLVAVVAAKFEENVSSSFEGLYPEYAAEMEQIRMFLENLRTKAESQLTPKEKIEKEIIQTLLRLAVHSHEGNMGLAW